KKRNHFNYAVIRKWFIRLMVVGGILAFIAALIGAAGEANEERGLSMDGTVAVLMLVGAAMAIGILLAAERFNKERKDYYGGIYIFFVIGCALT
ncbi:hypothetical protein, partial [Streptomyces caniscabiei]|uniref:hypothetical protein n=1 Tax=Streptomyces caniscabiei TaxID=2746961 RepID=UPI0038F6205E